MGDAPQESSPDTGFQAFALLKYSFVTTASLRGRLPWNHVPQRSNLFAVFDKVSYVEQDKSVRILNLLKIAEGPNLIERIALEQLVLQADEDERIARTRPLDDADRRCLIIIKKPFIAIRYQLADRQSRRIQLNFREEAGYDSALQILISFRLPIRDKIQAHDPVHRSIGATSAAPSSRSYQTSTVSTHPTSNTSYSMASRHAPLFNDHSATERGSQEIPHAYARTGRPMLPLSSNTALLPGSIVPDSHMGQIQSRSYLIPGGRHVILDNSPTCADPLRRSLFTGVSRIQQAQTSEMEPPPLHLLPSEPQPLQDVKMSGALQHDSVAQSPINLDKGTELQIEDSGTQRPAAPRRAPKRRATTSKPKVRTSTSRIKKSKNYIPQQDHGKGGSGSSLPRRRARKSPELVVKLALGTKAKKLVHELFSGPTQVATESAFKKPATRRKQPARKAAPSFGSTATQTQTQAAFEVRRRSYVSVATQTKAKMKTERRASTLCEEAAAQTGSLASSTPKTPCRQVLSAIPHNEVSNSPLYVPPYAPRAKAPPVNKFGRSSFRADWSQGTKPDSSNSSMPLLAFNAPTINKFGRRLSKLEARLSPLPPSPWSQPRRVNTRINKFGRSLSNVGNPEGQLSPLLSVPISQIRRHATRTEELDDGLNRGNKTDEQLSPLPPLRPVLSAERSQYSAGYINKPETQLSPLPPAPTPRPLRRAPSTRRSGYGSSYIGKPEEQLSPLPPAPTPRPRRTATSTNNFQRNSRLNKFRGPTRSLNI